jgi:hypothetical protein
VNVQEQRFANRHRTYEFYASIEDGQIRLVKSTITNQTLTTQGVLWLNLIDQSGNESRKEARFCHATIREAWDAFLDHTW